jgi:hypothetical protein
MKDKYLDAEDKGRRLFQEDFGHIFHIEYTQGRHDNVDLYMTAATDPSRTYVGEIKAYLNPQHPRPYSKYDDYMIDYDKLRHIKKIGINEDRTPVLISYFSDYCLVWDLNEVEWESTATWELVNCKGMEYGNKEWELMAHLTIDDAIYRKRMEYEERDNWSIG